MNKISKENLVIVIFPYLFIYDKGGLEFDGLKIKPSYRENVDNEDGRIKNHLLNIVKLFRVGKNQQISHWSYIVSSLKTYKKWEELKNKLNKFSNIARFSQLRALENYDRFDLFNYFVFEIPKDQSSTGAFIHYLGVLNGENSINFYLEGNKADNFYFSNKNIRPAFLTAEQITGVEYFQIFYNYPGMLFSTGEAQKILRAIEWFNRSFSHDGRGVDSSEAILNIETALEALLRPADEDRNIKAQLKTALLNLFGHSQHLALWFDQFWQLRNSIVHGDVSIPSFLYNHPQAKTKKGHRNHLVLSREIFVRCLDIILKIRKEFPLLGLEEKLVSNKIRMSNAITILNKSLKKETHNFVRNLHEGGAFGWITGLRNDDLSVGKKETKDFGNRFLPLVRNDLVNSQGNSTQHQGLIDMIDNVVSWDGKNFGDLALLYSNLQEHYSFFYFQELELPVEILSLHNAAYHFFDFASWRLLTFYE